MVAHSTNGRTSTAEIRQRVFLADGYKMAHHAIDDAVPARLFLWCQFFHDGKLSSNQPLLKERTDA